MKFIMSLLIVAAMLFSSNAFADLAISLDKPSYNVGDKITLSGNVGSQQGMAVIIQLRSSSDMVAIEQKFPSSSGKFSATFTAEGPKWHESGTYTVLVSYDGQTAEKTFQFSKMQASPTENKQTVKLSVPKDKPIKQESQVLEKPKTKIEIRGFPDPAKSPQYYYDRYKDNPEFKMWFDSTFTGHTIQEIVGYRPTHVSGFPDSNYSPQYYIDRYNNEDLFRSWFERQFSEKTMYDVVGVTEQTMTIAPGWIKQYAKMWADSEIDDQHFIDRISNLISQGIIAVDDDVIKQGTGDHSIPTWFKNTAGWYSKNQITDDDFLSGVQYLIEKEIIVV